MAQDDSGFDNLDRPGRAAALVATRPRLVVNVTVAAAILLSWAVLLALAGDVATRAPDEFGPGAWLTNLLPHLQLPDWAVHFASLCADAAVPTGLTGFVMLWSMWVLMSVAMMLPSAAPMIRTYCEIADTAAAKGEPVAHPLVLVAGYLAVWAAAALAFAGLSSALAGAERGPAAAIVAPAALAIAGLYQFSGLKDACLKKCRNPFAVLFAGWSSRPSRIFRLGVQQGVWCLGCCWALMLVMFAVGVMNVFWMALIGLFGVVEKQLDGRLVSWFAGAILLVWAAALLVVSR